MESHEYIMGNKHEYIWSRRPNSGREFSSRRRRKEVWRGEKRILFKQIRLIIKLNYRRKHKISQR